MSANASPEKVRREVLCSPIAQWTSYRLAFDCCTRECWGERTIDLGAVAARRGGDILVAHVVNQAALHGVREAPYRRAPRDGAEDQRPARRVRRVMLRGLFPVGDGR